MKEAAVLMSFLRHDPVGQRFGVGALVLAWFALAWTSLAAALAVPLVLVRLLRHHRLLIDPVEAVG